MPTRKPRANTLFSSGKGVSTIISTIIITATLLIILVIASFVSANVLDMQIANTEFEQAKTNMLTLDETIQDVALRRGSGGYVQFNQRNGGIGINITTQRLTVLGPPLLTHGSVILRPNGAGTFQNWTTFGAGLAHSDRTSDQNDGTGVQVVGSTSLRETENLEDIFQNATINYVIAHMRARTNGTGGAERGVFIWRTYNTNYETSTELTISQTALTDYSETRSINPNTALAWTWTEISALQIGARATALGSSEALQVSEFWVVVDYTGILPDVIYESSPLVGILYRGGSKVSGTDLDLRGIDALNISMLESLGYVRVSVDNGLKIKLDYFRIRIAQGSSIMISNTQYSLTQITFINIINGNTTGTDIVTFKVQNIDVNTTIRQYNTNDVNITVQAGSTISPPIRLYTPPTANMSTPNTAIIFTEVKILVSTS